MNKPLNFLPNELRPQRRQPLLVLLVSCLLTVLLALLLCGGLYLQRESAWLQQQVILLQEADPSASLYALLQERSELQAQLGQEQQSQTAPPEALDVLPLLNLLSEALPPQTVLQEIYRAGPASVSLRGSCAELAQLAEYLSTLQDLQLGQRGPAEIGRTEISPRLSSGFQFVLELTWTAEDEAQ